MVGGFSGNPRLESIGNGEWLLLEPFTYTCKDGRVVVVPEGFVTDLSSIPWIVSPLFKSVNHNPAGIIHDYLYCSKVVSRKEADRIFKEMLLNPTSKAKSYQVTMMYVGVRVGGGGRWNKKHKCVVEHTK